MVASSSSASSLSASSSLRLSRSGRRRRGTTASMPWGWIRALPLRASSSEERRQRSEATPMASPGTGAPVTLRVPLGRPRRRLGGEDGTGVGSAEDADATSDEVGSAVPTDAPGATSEEGAPSPSPSPSRARSDTARESRARATADPPGRAASSLATSRDRGHVPSNPSRRDQRTGGRRSLTRAGVTREGAPLATRGRHAHDAGDDILSVVPARVSRVGVCRRPNLRRG